MASPAGAGELPQRCSACGSRTRVPWLRTRNPFRWTNAPGGPVCPPSRGADVAARTGPVRYCPGPWASESHSPSAVPADRGAPLSNRVPPVTCTPGRGRTGDLPPFEGRSYLLSYRSHQLRTGRPGSRPRAPVLGWCCLDAKPPPRRGPEPFHWEERQLGVHSESLAPPRVFRSSLQLPGSSAGSRGIAWVGHYEGQNHHRPCAPDETRTRDLPLDRRVL